MNYIPPLWEDERGKEGEEEEDGQTEGLPSRASAAPAATEGNAPAPAPDNHQEPHAVPGPPRDARGPPMGPQGVPESPKEHLNEAQVAT